jgi:uncharacterized damage-inducible protein DinB
MKSHFLSLFDYDHMANRILFGLVKDACEPTATAHSAAASSLSLLAHLLASNQVWLLRCRGESSSAIELWPPDKTLEDLDTQIEDRQRDWVSLLEREQDFERSFTYANQSGKTYTNVLRDVLAHVINHGTHHRAQIGQRLKSAGLEKLPPTDYIAYLRITGK